MYNPLALLQRRWRYCQGWGWWWGWRWVRNGLFVFDWSHLSLDFRRLALNYQTPWYGPLQIVIFRIPLTLQWYVFANCVLFNIPLCVWLTTILVKSGDQNGKCLKPQWVNYNVCFSQISNTTVREHSNTKYVAWILKEIISQKKYGVIRPSFDTLFKISVPFFANRNAMLQFTKNHGSNFHPVKKTPLPFVCWERLPVFFFLFLLK